jgi:2-polyprenyl-3-methyl-5-hydroxy-6-metoxy-1,4-benzoquinol methylase
MITCPVCKIKEGFRLVEKIDQFSIYECPECGLQFADPLAYSTDLYDEQYNISGGITKLRKLPKSILLKKAHMSLSSPQRQVLLWIKKYLPQSSPVLEIGCGGGTFLAALEREGFQSMGVDVAKEPISLLKQKGFQAHLGSIDNLPSEWPRPKAIVILEVIEHLPDPVGFIRNVHNKFPEIPLLLSTPSWARWCLHLGYRQSEDYPPNHLLRWTKRSVNKALNNAGYAEVNILLPKISAKEFYQVTQTALLYKLRLFNKRAPQKVIHDKKGKPLLSKLINNYPSIVIALDNTATQVSRIMLFPLAAFFNMRGYSSSSILVIAYP